MLTCSITNGGIMAVDAYLQIEGIKGESQDSAHKEEHFQLKFAKVTWKYTQQKISGGAGGSTAGGWDLSANKVSA